MTRINRAYRFVRRDIWRTTEDGFGKGKRMGLSTLKTLIVALKGFNENDINMRANSLTYSMMFAIVPILALIIAFARGFGFEQVIEEQLNSSFLGQYHIVPTIMGFVQRYLETAQGGVFLGVGILILLWAVYSFFRNVESSFNLIWQVEKSRSITRQFANYLTILILIPILIIVSSGISIFVNTTLAEVALFDGMGAVKEFLLKCLPWGVSWLMFTMMYLTIPNTKVRLKSALIPGIFIGTLVEILQSLSVYLIMFLSRTSIVYGTFAVLPLLLTWLQWTCLLILTGAEISYAIQNKESMDFLSDTEHMSRRYKDYLTLYICRLIILRFRDDLPALSAEQIAQQTHLPVRVVNTLISSLEEVGVISKVAREHEHEAQRYQPALDISRITVGMLFERIDRQGVEGFFPHLPEEMQSFWNTWVELNKQQNALSLPVQDLAG